MSVRTTLGSRDAELAAGARAAYAASRGRPVLVLVEGEPGAGKTALLEEIAREAVRRVASVVRWARPDYASFMVARDAIRALPSEQFVCLLLDDADEVGGDCAALLTRLLDDESARPLLVLISARPPRRHFARTAVDLLAGGVPGIRLWLRGVSADTASGAQPAPSSTASSDARVAATAGNPAWLGAIQRGEASSDDPGPALTRAATELLASLDAGERAVVDLLAHADGALPTSVVGRALGGRFSVRSIRRSLGPLLEDGGLGLRLDSQLLRIVAREAVSTEDRREIHRTLAAATEGPQRSHHLLAALGPEGDASLADEFEQDGLAALKTGDWHVAALALARASRAHPQSDQRERLLLEAGCIIGLAEDLDLARQFGADVAALTRSPLRDVLLSGLTYFAGQFEQAIDTLSALLRATGDDELRGRGRALALVIISSARAIIGQTAAALDAGRAAAATPVPRSDPIRPLLRRVMWMQIASAEWANGHIVDALSITDRLLDADSGRLEHTDTLLLRGAIHFYGGRTLAAHDDLKRGDALADATMAVLRRRMSEHTVIDFHLGNWTQAQQRGLRTIAAGRRNGDLRGIAATEAVIAMIAAARGDDARADATLASAKAFAHRPSPFVALHVATADAWIARERMNPAAVLEALAPIRESSVADWSERIGLFAWRALHIGALIGVGRLDEADDECRHLTTLVSRRPAVPLVHGHPEWLAGRISAARGDVGRARAQFASARLLSLGTPYPSALVALSAASLEREAGRDDEANLHLDEALRIFHGLEASAAAARTRQALEREKSFHLLSVRERHVARLAARGHTNETIASELVISVKTVEFHVARILRKLGHASRRDLWSARDTEPAGE